MIPGQMLMMEGTTNVALGFLDSLLAGVGQVFTTVSGNDMLSVMVYGIPVAGGVIGLAFRIFHRH